MIGTTLREIRDRIETLSSDDGEYRLVCGRFGTGVVPARGLRFESRSAARAAARATEQYRSELRRYDPEVPLHDVVVCRADGDGPVDADRVVRRDRVEFCHRVAAAVFESLSERGHDAVETAVMDAYLDLAERLSDPNDLCLCLLESTARELATGLSPPERASVLATAARRLDTVETAVEAPVDASLDHLRARGLLGEYARSPWRPDPEADTTSVVVRLSEYALSPGDGGLPVLPVVVELHRRLEEWRPERLTVARAGDRWRLAIALARDPDPATLATAPIRSEVH